MEKITLKKSVLAFVQTCICSFICAFVAGAGYMLGNFQAVLYALILEICCLFCVGVFVDNFDAQIEDYED